MVIHFRQFKRKKQPIKRYQYEHDSNKKYFDGLPEVTIIFTTGTEGSDNVMGF